MLKIEEHWRDRQIYQNKLSRIKEAVERIKVASQHLFSGEIIMEFTPSRSLEMGLIDFQGFRLYERQFLFFKKELLRFSDITDQCFVYDKRLRALVREEVARSLFDLDVNIHEY